MFSFKPKATAHIVEVSANTKVIKPGFIAVRLPDGDMLIVIGAEADVPLVVQAAGKPPIVLTNAS